MFRPHTVTAPLIVAAYFCTMASVYAAPLTYADGVIADAASECGAGDVCATLTFPGGDVLRVYNEGAAKCQAFVLHVVRSHGDTVLLSYDLSTDQRHSRFTYANSQVDPYSGNVTTYAHSRDKCGRFRNSYYMFDNGRIRMGVFLAKDGALFAQFDQPSYK